MEKISKAIPDKRVKVQLKRPHTHAGIHYDQALVDHGVEIEISEDQEKALKIMGVI